MDQSANPEDHISSQESTQKQIELIWSKIGKKEVQGEDYQFN